MLRSTTRPWNAPRSVITSVPVTGVRVPKVGGVVPPVPTLSMMVNAPSRSGELPGMTTGMPPAPGIRDSRTTSEST